MEQKDIRKLSEKAATLIVFTLTICLCAILVTLCVIAVNLLWGLM